MDNPALLSLLKKHLESLQQKSRTAKSPSLLQSPSQNPFSPPYFAYFQVEEKGQKKHFYLGLDTYKTKDFQVLNWQTSPYAAIYYKYNEQDEFFESFSDAERTLEKEGVLLVKCALTIEQGQIKQIRRQGKVWRLDAEDQETPKSSFSLDVSLGKDEIASLREKKFLPDITALLSKEQFAAIEKPLHTILILHGVAGSGKTTVALHRMAWLLAQQASIDPAKVYILVQSKALGLYIQELIKSLTQTRIQPFVLEELYHLIFQALYLRNDFKEPREITSSAALHFKKSKFYQALLDQTLAAWQEQWRQGFAEIEDLSPFKNTRQLESLPFLKKLWIYKLFYDFSSEKTSWKAPSKFLNGIRKLLERWVDLDLVYLSPGFLLFHSYHKIFDDFVKLEKVLQSFLPDQPGQMKALLESLKEDYVLRQSFLDQEEFLTTESEQAPYDSEDQISLIYLYQNYFDALPDSLQTLLAPFQKGYLPNRKLKKGVWRDQELASKVEFQPDFCHFPSHKPWSLDVTVIDEVQDLSLMEIQIFHALNTQKCNLVLSGDLNQKIYHQGGLETWDDLNALFQDAKPHYERLKVSYRTTKPILDFAFSLLESADEKVGVALKQGKEVRLLAFSSSYALESFVAEWLQALSDQTSLLSLGLLFPTARQAKDFYRALESFEIPRLRLVEDQNFTFQPGFDVTTIHDVKGLEYDSVIVFYADSKNFPATTYARRLLHTAATRASMELSLVLDQKISPLITPEYQQKLLYI